VCVKETKKKESERESVKHTYQSYRNKPFGANGIQWTSPVKTPNVLIVLSTRKFAYFRSKKETERRDGGCDDGVKRCRRSGSETQ
jgi:hypothetical protein